MMNEFGAHGWGWGMGWGWIVGLIILITIIWILYKAVNTNRKPPQEPHKTALDILKERYARGEIDKQEFDERKKDLQ